MKKELNIAFFGSSLVSAYWNGAATYYRGIIKTLNSLGHRVTFYEPDVYERQQNRDIDDPDWARVVVYQPNKEELFRCLDESEQADIVIKASGIGIFDQELEHEVVRRKNNGQKVIFWDVDAPATLSRLKDAPEDPFLKLIPLYDLFLTYGGGEPVENEYESLGAKKCISIYNAFDPEIHYPVRPDEKYVCDMAFLGNRLPDREARVDEFFFKVARLMPEKTFILGGSGWQDKPMPQNIKYIGHVPTKSHNAFNCSPLAVLNISRESMATYGFSPATRVFEAAGAGACIITDTWRGIDLFLQPDDEILVAEVAEDIVEMLAYLNDKISKSIGAAARKRVLQNHTYANRGHQLEDVCKAVMAQKEMFV